MQPVSGHHPTHMVQGMVDVQPFCFPVVLQLHRLRPRMAAPRCDGTVLTGTAEAPPAPWTDDVPVSVSSAHELSEYPLFDRDDCSQDLGARGG